MADITIYDYPPREELWSAVQEAHDYLQQYLNDPSSRVHPIEGEVKFNAYSWGEPDPDGEGEYEVCLAGLWHLRKVGRLLTVSVNDHDEYENLPPICRFLDKLRCPGDNGDEIEQWLGVDTTYYPSQDEKTGGMLYSDNPEHILKFLTWLLQQRDIQHSNGRTNDS